MALYKRLGSIFGISGVAAALAVLSLATVTPARAGGDVQIFLGFPSVLGIGVDRRHYRKPPHWHPPRYQQEYYHQRHRNHWHGRDARREWRDHGRHDRRWIKHDRGDNRHRGGRDDHRRW